MEGGYMYEHPIRDGFIVANDEEKTDLPIVKHGDRVECCIDGHYVNDARISVDSDGGIFICQNYKVNGYTESKISAYSYSWRIYEPHNDAEDTGLEENFVTNFRIIDKHKFKVDEYVRVGTVKPPDTWDNSMNTKMGSMLGQTCRIKECRMLRHHGAIPEYKLYETGWAIWPEMCFEQVLRQGFESEVKIDYRPLLFTHAFQDYREGDYVEIDLTSLSDSFPLKGYLSRCGSHSICLCQDELQGCNCSRGEHGQKYSYSISIDLIKRSDSSIKKITPSYKIDSSLVVTELDYKSLNTNSYQIRSTL